MPCRNFFQLDKDGGYKDIVVRVSSSVPEDSCPKIMANIKVKKISDLIILMRKFDVRWR